MTHILAGEYSFEEFRKTARFKKPERLPILRRKLLGLPLEKIREVRKLMEKGRNFESAMNYIGIYA